MDAALRDQPESNIDDTELVETTAKTVRLSLHLIVKRHLPQDATDWPQDKIISELNKIKRVRLDREYIGEIDSLELFSAHVTNLYLQCNRISVIQNLECLPNLQVLVLSGNSIQTIEGISHLQNLVFLDLSENCLQQVNCENLPTSIIILNLSRNPSLNKDDYSSAVIHRLPKLKQLNEVEISVRDKINAGALKEWDDDDGDTSNEEDENDEDMQERHASNVRPSEDMPPLVEASVQDTSSASSFKQLPKIESSIQSLAADILLRSQQRLEEVSTQHKKHVQQITNIRIKSKIQPVRQISRPK